MKTCPKCKSEVPADAKVCASCRHEFRGAIEQGFRVVLIVGLALVGVIVFLVFFGTKIGL